MAIYGAVRFFSFKNLILVLSLVTDKEMEICSNQRLILWPHKDHVVKYMALQIFDNKVRMLVT